MTTQRHKPEMKVQLLCIAYPSVIEGWEGFCLDFDIAVQGRSFDEVKRHLEGAIISYVRDAMKEEEPYRSRLLNRRAPFHVRLFWAWRLFMDTIRTRRDHDNDVAVGFPVSCPA